MTPRRRRIVLFKRVRNLARLAGGPDDHDGFFTVALSRYMLELYILLTEF